MIYAITALGYGGVFTAFTFLAPMMQELAGFSPSAVSWILLGYGVSVAIGNVGANWPIYMAPSPR